MELEVHHISLGAALSFAALSLGLVWQILRYRDRLKGQGGEDANLKRDIMELQRWREEHKRQCTTEHEAIRRDVKDAVRGLSEHLDRMDREAVEHRRRLHEEIHEISNDLAHLKGRFTERAK